MSFEEIGISEEELDGETLSYLITSHLERFPIEGEELQLDIELHPIDKEAKEEPLKKKLIIKILQITANTIGDLKISIQ